MNQQLSIFSQTSILTIPGWISFNRSISKPFWGHLIPISQWASSSTAHPHFCSVTSWQWDTRGRTGGTDDDHFWFYTANIIFIFKKITYLLRMNQQWSIFSPNNNGDGVSHFLSRDSPKNADLLTHIEVFRRHRKYLNGSKHDRTTGVVCHAVTHLNTSMI